VPCEDAGQPVKVKEEFEFNVRGPARGTRCAELAASSAGLSGRLTRPRAPQVFDIDSSLFGGAEFGLDFGEDLFAQTVSPDGALPARTCRADAAAARQACASRRALHACTHRP